MYCFFPVLDYSFFSSFKFFSVFVFQLFEYDVCRNGTLSVYPTWCYLNFLRVNIFHQTWAFSANISLNVFSFTFISILSFCDSHYVFVGNLNLFSFFFCHLFSVFFRLDGFYGCIFKFTVLVFCPSQICCWVCVVSFKIWLLCFPSL